MNARWLLPLLFASTLPGFAQAQAIYPIDRATMLAGGKFDFKVEFDSVLKPADVRILINGKDYQQVLGKSATFVEREDGQDVSAVWIRDVFLPQAGKYEVEAQANGKTSKVTWDVYPSAEKRKAKNVILFIGDGLSVAHRTGARILSKGVTEGKADGRLAIDDLQYMAFAGTSSTDSIAADSANTMSAYMTGHKSGYADHRDRRPYARLVNYRYGG